MLVWIDPQARLLVVDAGSQARADEAVTSLVKAAPGLSLMLLQSTISPAVAMAQWLVSGEAPAGFTIDRDCELKSADEMKSIVRYARHGLDTDDVRQHIEGGKMPTRLAMSWNDRVSFVLTEGLQLKKIAFLDGVFEPGAQKDDRFDADAAISTGELRQLIPDLIEALGGELDALAPLQPPSRSDRRASRPPNRRSPTDRSVQSAMSDDQRLPLLPAGARPRPAARSVQLDRRAAADRLDLVARRRRHAQPGAVQLLQRLQLHAADHRLLEHRRQGHAGQRAGERRIRLEPGDPRGCAEAMNASCAAVPPEVDEFALAGLTPAPSRRDRRAAGRRKPGLVRMPRQPDRCSCRPPTARRSTAGSSSARWSACTSRVSCCVDGIYQTAAAQPILRAGGPADYFELGERFQMRRPR